MRPARLVGCAVLFVLSSTACRLKSHDDGGTGPVDSGGPPDAAVSTGWTASDAGTAVTLRGVSASGATWVAVGDLGTVVTSTDLGATWVARDAGASVQLNGVFSAQGTSWIVGNAGTALVSRDEARTWAPLALGTTDDLVAVWAADADHAYLLGKFYLYRTTDSGQSFTPKPTPSGTPCVAMWGTSPNELFMVNDGSLFLTFDGAETMYRAGLSLAAQRGLWVASPLGAAPMVTVNGAGVATEVFFVAQADGGVDVGPTANKWGLLPSVGLTAAWGTPATATLYVTSSAGTVYSGESAGMLHHDPKLTAPGALLAVSGTEAQVVVVGELGAVFKHTP